MGFFFKRLIPAALMLSSGAAFATNGMLMEGYGPISSGMGGASIAFDNGTAAVMNNPATLGLMKEGTKIEIAVGRLGPSVKSSYGAFSADSSATAFYMPAVGYIRKNGVFTYGVGAFAQGGMGAEYGADSFLALGSGQNVRSEVGVMRVVAPLAYEVQSNLIVAGTLDLVRTSMDLKMAVAGDMLASMVKSCSGGACAGLGGLGSSDWGRFDFSDNSSFSGAASNYGVAAKLGLVYQVSPEINVGAIYHSQTFTGDLKTDSTDATLSMNSGFSDSGKVTIKDFEMPSTFGVGAAWTPMAKLMVAADYRRINWSSVMEAFKMNYSGSSMVSSLDVEMTQKWEDQNIFALGAGYEVMDELTLRAGLSLGNNPVPDAYVNPLFPATIKNHYNVGAGYIVGQSGVINGSLTYAPEVSVNSGMGPTIKHSQMNIQLMYTYNY